MCVQFQCVVRVCFKKITGFTGGHDRLGVVVSIIVENEFTTPSQFADAPPPADWVGASALSADDLHFLCRFVHSCV